MEQTKYLSIMSDEQIKKVAQKLCNGGYSPMMNRNHNAKSYKLQRNNDNVIVTMKCPKMNRLSFVVMTDYNVAIVEEGWSFNYGQKDTFEYRNLMSNLFGDDYRKDVNVYEEEIYKNLGLHRYINQITDEEFLNYFKRWIDKDEPYILKNSLELSRTEDGSKFILMHREDGSKNVFTNIYSDYHFVRYDEEENGKYMQYSFDRLQCSFWINYLVEKFGKQPAEDYIKFSNAMFNTDKAIYKYAYDKNVEYIRKNVKEETELNKELTDLKSRLTNYFHDYHYIKNYFENNILDEKLVKNHPTCYLNCEEYLAKTDYEEKCKKELNDIFGNTKTEEMENEF